MAEENAKGGPATENLAGNIQTVDQALLDGIGVEFRNELNKIQQKDIPQARKDAEMSELSRRWWRRLLVPFLTEKGKENLAKLIDANVDVQKKFVELIPEALKDTLQKQREAEKKVLEDIEARFDDTQSRGIKQYFSAKTAAANGMITAATLAGLVGAVCMLIPNSPRAQAFGSDLMTLSTNLSDEAAKRMNAARLETEAMVKGPTGDRWAMKERWVPQITPNFVAPVAALINSGQINSLLAPSKALEPALANAEGAGARFGTYDPHKFDPKPKKEGEKENKPNNVNPDPDTESNEPRGISRPRITNESGSSPRITPPEPTTDPHQKRRPTVRPTSGDAGGILEDQSSLLTAAPAGGVEPVAKQVAMSARLEANNAPFYEQVDPKKAAGSDFENLQRTANPAVVVLREPEPTAPT